MHLYKMAYIYDRNGHADGEFVTHDCLTEASCESRARAVFGTGYLNMNSPQCGVEYVPVHRIRRIELRPVEPKIPPPSDEFVS